MKLKGLTIATLICLITISLSGQDKLNRFGLELNGGLSFPNGKIGEATIYPGAGFEALIQYNLISRFDLYGGWGWNSLPSITSFAGDDISFEETGYIFGLQYSHNLGKSSSEYFIRGGGLFNHIELEDDKGDIIADSGHGLGWQIAGGISLPLGSGWSLNPGLKFNSLKRDVEIEGVSTELAHDYFSVRLGINKKF